MREAEWQEGLVQISRAKSKRESLCKERREAAVSNFTRSHCPYQILAAKDYLWRYQIVKLGSWKSPNNSVKQHESPIDGKELLPLMNQPSDTQEKVFCLYYV